jgi:hypothetical protein
LHQLDSVRRFHCLMFSSSFSALFLAR